MMLYLFLNINFHRGPFFAKTKQNIMTCLIPLNIFLNRVCIWSGTLNIVINRLRIELLSNCYFVLYHSTFLLIFEIMTKVITFIRFDFVKFIFVIFACQVFGFKITRIRKIYSSISNLQVIFPKTSWL